MSRALGRRGRRQREPRPTGPTREGSRGRCEAGRGGGFLGPPAAVSPATAAAISPAAPTAVEPATAVAAVVAPVVPATVTAAEEAVVARARPRAGSPPTATAVAASSADQVRDDAEDYAYRDHEQDDQKQFHGTILPVDAPGCKIVFYPYAFVRYNSIVPPCARARVVY